MKNTYSIVNWDCILEMKDISDNNVDLILTDPPYNLGLFMKNRDTNLWALRSNHFVAADWDHVEQDEWESNMNIFFEESSRILKKKWALLIFVSLIKIETIIKLAQKHGFYYKTTGIWHKTNPMPRNMNLHFVNSTEAWIYFINDGRTWTFNNEWKMYHDFYESSIIGNKEKKHWKHPTQKPINLMKHFVELLSNKWDFILDPFMWSWSTGVASVSLDRFFYWIELNKEYINIADKRISKSYNLNITNLWK